MNEERPFELPSPIKAELKKLEQERTEWFESDSAASATKNDDRQEPEQNLGQPIPFCPRMKQMSLKVTRLQRS
jgi:hypothetical protein